MARYLLPLTLLAALLVPAPGSSAPHSASVVSAHEICCPPLLLRRCCYRPLLRPRLFYDGCILWQPRVIVRYHCCGPIVVDKVAPKSSDESAQPTPATPADDEGTTDPIPDLSQPPQEPQDPDKTDADDPDGETPPNPDDTPAADDAPDTNDLNATVTINLELPAEARVQINGHPTRLSGTHRRFISTVPAGNSSRRFTIQADLVRDGQHIRETRTVSLQPGESSSLKIGLLSSGATTTTLTLNNLPEGAQVILQGQETSVVGATRVFRTRTLAPGQTWKDYAVKIQLHENGKTLTWQQKIDLVGGQSHQLTIPLSQPQVATNH
jgi:uncharacterized protein (TIGR03000 family)